MLYNESTGKPKVQADVFSLESLIAWLEKQPADSEYCYFDSGTCLLTQYFAAAGFQNVYVFVDGFWQGQDKIPGWVGQDEAIAIGRLTRMPPVFNHIAQTDWRNRTFGAALSRARKALAS